ncbi:MAG TPA: mercuric reductase [Vicinamibacterales bacterium]|jgi:pyruvate/2-oxoglutarate dehydrogenase complex dihydrolipoamide dehydrogenase (E3) component|nr:mercuric reductase [Vicinamibacterales bacterium]
MPADSTEARLRAAVHPPGWANPQPRWRYDLLVLGGGTAGLVSAMGAAGLGARVALVERGLLGGDCLNTGCVPSKALLRSARSAAEARRAPEVGVRTGAIEADFPSVMRRMRERRADLSAHDSAARLLAAGVDLYFGEARFTGAASVAVDGRALTFRRAVIATGGRAVVPPIPGLAAAPFLTTDTLFDLTEQPRRLAIVGAGPAGCEMAQAFARLGTAVTLIDQTNQVLPQEDADAAAIVARRLTADGVTLQLGVALTEVPAGFDCLLIAAGRAPNVDALDLAAAGVAFTSQGVVVDDRLRTSNRRIFAAGDVCSRFKFTHAADAAARIVIQNALFFGRARASALVIPWCTYTDPEVAHVGAYEQDATRAGHRVTTITIPLADIDRAVVDEEGEGFVRVHHERGRLLGCTVVASRAGEMIGVATHALTHGARLGDLGSTIHPYPTLTNAFRAAGDAYARTRLTPVIRSLLRRYFRLV